MLASFESYSHEQLPSLDLDHVKLIDYVNEHFLHNNTNTVVPSYVFIRDTLRMFLDLSKSKFPANDSNRHLVFKKNWVDVVSGSDEDCRYEAEFVYESIKSTLRAVIQTNPSYKCDTIVKARFQILRFFVAYLNDWNTFPPVAVDQPSESLTPVEKFIFSFYKETASLIKDGFIDDARIFFTFADILFGCYRYNSYISKLFQ